MRAPLVFLCVLFFSVSCSNKIPKGIMPPEKMQAVVTDILIADVLNNERILKDTALKLPVENASYFQKIFQLHHISKKEFDRSYTFYLKRPDLFRVISDSVNAVLNRRNDNLIKGTDTLKNRPHGDYLKKTSRLPGSQQ